MDSPVILIKIALLSVSVLKLAANFNLLGFYFTLIYNQTCNSCASHSISFFICVTIIGPHIKQLLNMSVYVIYEQYL
jgi:hypothetical protein